MPYPSVLGFEEILFDLAPVVVAAVAVADTGAVAGIVVVAAAVVEQEQAEAYETPWPKSLFPLVFPTRPKWPWEELVQVQLVREKSVL